MKKTAPTRSVLPRLLLVFLLVFTSIGTSLTALCAAACAHPGRAAIGTAAASVSHACCIRGAQPSRSVARPACAPQGSEQATSCEMGTSSQVNGASADGQESRSGLAPAVTSQTPAPSLCRTSSQVFARITHPHVHPASSSRIPLRI